MEKCNSKFTLPRCSVSYNPLQSTWSKYSLLSILQDPVPRPLQIPNSEAVQAPPVKWSSLCISCSIVPSHVFSLPESVLWNSLPCCIAEGRMTREMQTACFGRVWPLFMTVFHLWLHMDRKNDLYQLQQSALLIVKRSQHYFFASRLCSTMTFSLLSWHLGDILLLHNIF